MSKISNLQFLLINKNFTNRCYYCNHKQCQKNCGQCQNYNQCQKYSPNCPKKSIVKKITLE
jgi:hypothetical protein